MNNSCPSCGAIYNVAGKDIGRRLKCKKCGTPLTVTDAGIALDQPSAEPAAAPPVAVAEEVFGTDDLDTPPRRGRRRYGGPGVDFAQLLAEWGGLPTLFFGVGAFFVITFLFLPIIGDAAVDRAEGRVERLKLEWEAQERQMRKDKKSEEDISKARETFDKRSVEYAEDVRYERISNKRALWMERYGMLFGFILLMIGSLGYMTPNQPPIRRIVGAVVITAQMLIVFMIFAPQGCAGGGRVPFVK